MRSRVHTCGDTIVCVHLDCTQFGRKWHSTEFGDSLTLISVSVRLKCFHKDTTEQCQGCICSPVVPMLGIT